MANVYKTLGQAVVGSTRTFNTITNKAITANVATLTTASPHGLAIGDVVVVSGVDSTFDGTHSVATVPTSTTFTFMSTTATVASVASAGQLIRTHNLGGATSSNKLGTGSFVTITCATAHGLSVNDWVRVEVGDTNIDTVAKVVAVVSTPQFMIAKTGTAVGSTAVTTGAISRLNPSTWTQLYLVPAATNAIVSTIAVTNQTASAAQYRIGITDTANSAPAISEMLVFDGTVAANDTVTLTLGITMAAAKKILVNANSPEISFSAFGSEIS